MYKTALVSKNASTESHEETDQPAVDPDKILTAQYSRLSLATIDAPGNKKPVLKIPDADEGDSGSATPNIQVDNIDSEPGQDAN